MSYHGADWVNSHAFYFIFPITFSYIQHAYVYSCAQESEMLTVHGKMIVITRAFRKWLVGKSRNMRAVVKFLHPMQRPLSCLDIIVA